MFEGTKFQVDKLENGYGIKTGSEQLGTLRKYVFVDFREFIGAIAKMFGEREGQTENYPSLRDHLIESSRRSGKSLWMGVDLAKEEPTIDDMRDEIGELRRRIERMQHREAELMEVNSRLVKAEKAADDHSENLNKLVHGRDQTIAAQKAEIDDLRQTLTRAGVRIRKKPASRKR